MSCLLQLVLGENTITVVFTVLGKKGNFFFFRDLHIFLVGTNPCNKRKRFTKKNRSLLACAFRVFVGATQGMNNSERGGFEVQLT